MINKTKIFLDSGNPEETKRILKELGQLDGQTTNPSLVAKHPEVQKCIGEGMKCTKDQVYGYYKEIVQEIRGLIPDGSVSIEVYADKNTTSLQMIGEAKKLNMWIDDAHIKLPTTIEGLKAAEILVSEGIRVNMTLCFSQEQAAAVHIACKKAVKGQVYVSPFIGRIDDKGLNGFDLIRNIHKMYKENNSPVEVLAASLRNTNHFFACLQEEIDIMTVPTKVFDMWFEEGKHEVSSDFSYAPDLQEIPYQNLDLSYSWDSFEIQHELTDIGLQRFSDDWNKLIG